MLVNCNRKSVTIFRKNLQNTRAYFFGPSAQITGQFGAQKTTANNGYSFALD